MSTPKEHIPVRLVSGFIFKSARDHESALKTLVKKFGKIDAETDILDFNATTYYAKEMGNILKRKFVSFEKLIHLKNSYNIKHYTNRIEKIFSKNKRRSVNIDPGYVTLTNLVLSTAKPRSHRVYIDRGIYAENELEFREGSFRFMQSTYPDYKSDEYIAFFNSVRRKYFSEIKAYL